MNNIQELIYIEYIYLSIILSGSNIRYNIDIDIEVSIKQIKKNIVLILFVFSYLLVFIFSYFSYKFLDILDINKYFKYRNH